MIKKIVVIVGSLSLIALILVFSLFNGIKIDNISTSGANISKLYLKYDKKLIITIKKVDILPSTDDSGTKFDPSYIKIANEVLSYIQYIKIDNIIYDKHNINFEYKNRKLTIKSDMVNLETNFNIIDTKVDFLSTIYNKDLKIYIKGDITNNLLYYNISSANIKDLLWLKKYITLSQDQLDLIENQLKFNYIKIESINGIVDLDDPANIDTKKIQANITIKDLSVKYDKYPKVEIQNIAIELKDNNITTTISKKNQLPTSNITLDGTIITTIDGKDIKMKNKLYYSGIVFKNYTTIKNDIISYKISSSSIDDISIFQRFVEFPSSIKTWAIDRLKSRSTTIENISGKIYLNPTDVDLGSLRVDAFMDDIIMNFNPNKAYPLKAKKVKVHFDGKDMAIDLVDPVSNDVDLSGSKATIYDMFNDSGLLLDLKTKSALNETLVRAVASYGVDIVNELKLKQIKGSSDINVKIDIPFSSKPLDIRVGITNSDSILSIKDQNISFSTFDFLYEDNSIKIKNSKAGYKKYDIDLNNILFDITKNRLDLNTTITDNKIFETTILNSTDLNSKLSNGIFDIKFVDINNTIDIQNRSIPYFVNFDHNITFNLPTLNISYTKKGKIHNLILKDLKVFEDMVVDMDKISLKKGSLSIRSNDLKDIDLKLDLLSKPYIEDLAYDISFRSNTDLEHNRSDGNLILNNLKYNDIVDIDDTNIPYSANFSKNIELNLPTLTTKISKESNSTKITIDDIREYNTLVSKIDDYNLSKISLNTNIINGDNIALKLIGDISKYNIFYKKKRLDELTLNIDLRDKHLITINSDKNIINGNIDIAKDKKIVLNISNIGIEYKEDNSTKKEKNIQIYPPKCKNTKFDLPRIDLNLNNGYLKYNNNLLNYENIELKGYRSKLSMDLKENNTTVALKLDDENIELNSTKISSLFLNNIAGNSIANSGYIDLNISGKQCNIDGNITIHKMIIKDIATLKNIFLVINSAPALANPLLILPNAYRFASDGFNLSEYELKKGLVKFNLNRSKNILNLQQLYLVGIYSDFIAKGQINLWKKTIKTKVDVVFLKDYSKIIDFVPGLGYVLLGDEKRFSYSVDIDGKLNNPEVKTHIFKETILAPYNIIKRVVTSPF